MYVERERERYTNVCIICYIKLTIIIQHCMASYYIVE